MNDDPTTDPAAEEPSEDPPATDPPAENPPAEDPSAVDPGLLRRPGESQEEAGERISSELSAHSDRAQRFEDVALSPRQRELIDKALGGELGDADRDEAKALRERLRRHFARE